MPSPSFQYTIVAAITVVISASCGSPGLAGESNSPAVLDLFPPSTVSQGAGETSITTEFTPSQSSWAEGLDESAVFWTEMTHQQREHNSFQLRVGQGGQVYSLRGAFGESVPPSWRSSGGNASPWNDEVWQFVAVCTRYNQTLSNGRDSRIPDQVTQNLQASGYSDSYFIHNSGAYIPGDAAVKSLYCPQLATHIDRENKTIRTLNWGLVPQIKTIHRSPLLYYTQVRDAGDGVIEQTWVVHNFSHRDDIVFDHLNAPWGGTRISSLPFRYVSSPDGKLLEREGFLSEYGTVDVRKTGGWNISLQSNASDAPGLSLVYGRDKHLEEERRRHEAGEPYCQLKPSLYRDWRASAPLYEKGKRWEDWATRPENSFRNYDVCEIIPKLRIAPGSTIWFRSYLVVGSKDQLMEQASQLVDHVDYGLLNFDRDSTPLRQIGLSATNGQPAPQFAVYTRPVPGSKPLFMIRNSQTRRVVFTTDPYHFVEKERLNFDLPADHPDSDYYRETFGYRLDRNNSDWESLVGYALETKPEQPGWQKLSEVLGADTFPPTDSWHLDLWVKTN